MAASRVTRYLDQHHVHYSARFHPAVFTAQEMAAVTHIPGREVAKTVIVKADGELIMIVLPASDRVNFQQIRRVTGAKSVELASESEFMDLFPDSEVGAMPPFGNLYGMKVYVSPALCGDEEIAFNAGSHLETMKIAFNDYCSLVHPGVLNA